MFWCAADIGWVTGHSYIVYGPLANGATSMMFEGRARTGPTHSRLWQVVDRHQVATLFTAPTALRSLMREGDGFVTADRSAHRCACSAASASRSTRGVALVSRRGRRRSLPDHRHLVADGDRRQHDRALPGATAAEARIGDVPAAGRVARDGRRRRARAGRRRGRQSGHHARAGRGRCAAVWGDHDRFFETYFPTFPGTYFTGDGARRDADGYYWITGRIDDVINVSGHRMGTAEVESALVLHPKVAEAAVVGMPHAIKGQGIYAYRDAQRRRAAAATELQKVLTQWVRREIGPIATPDVVQFAPGLPKTRSGKIMRRILRKIAEGEVSSLGDTSTLADPSVVDALVADRQTVSG